MGHWDGVISGIVERPEDYRWCSLAYHLQTGNRDNFLSMDSPGFLVHVHGHFRAPDHAPCAPRLALRASHKRQKGYFGGRAGTDGGADIAGSLVYVNVHVVMIVETRYIWKDQGCNILEGEKLAAVGVAG